jgi:hypothetical protein
MEALLLCEARNFVSQKGYLLFRGENEVRVIDDGVLAM